MPPKKKIPKSDAVKGSGTSTQAKNLSAKKGPPSSSTTSLKSNKSSSTKSTAANNTDQASSDYQLMLEVMWCVQEIDALRTAKKTSAKQGEELQKVMRSLLSTKTALIKKRQLMRAYCGDYRQKMLKEDHKRKKVEAKLQEHPVLPKTSLFIRKVASTTTQNQEEGTKLEEVAQNLETLHIVDSNKSVDTVSDNNPTHTESTPLASLFKTKSSEPFQFKFPVSNIT